MPHLQLRRAPGRSAHRAILLCAGHPFHCSIGRGGITVRKREGDGATPAGNHRVVSGLFRRDRIRPDRDNYWLKPIRPAFGWCDDPSDPNYNRLVRLPFTASHEMMMRKDRQYDVCLVLDWNFSRRVRNRGSAIFLHLTNKDEGPTAGCVAVRPKDMRLLLSRIGPGSRLHVYP